MQKDKIIALVTLIVGLLLGYLLGHNYGYASGYKQATDDEAKKALIEAAKTSNPLKDIQSNPFDTAAKVINPF